MSHGSAAEGWYEDPYGVHEFRWFSDGTPTSLVRDGPVEATDPPPPGEVSGPLVPEEPAPEAGADGSDLLRADEAGTEDESEAPWDSMPQSFGMD
jgi:hypothetical protein